MMNQTCDIAVVLVTFNRLDTLKHSIACYESQTVKPACLIVVDNCSSDGTREYLKKYMLEQHPFKVDTVFLPENMGGAGGFYAGLRKALDDSSADWIYVADDDAFPETDCFEKACQFLKKNESLKSTIAAVCGNCVFDGRILSVQRAHLRNVFGCVQDWPVCQKEFKSGNPFRIDLYSFVGTILNRDKLLAAGLPRRDFFIYQDDYEHAVRMGKQGYIYLVPEIRIHHEDNFGWSRAASWRDYYASRNIVILYKTHMNRISLYVRIARRLLTASLSFNRKKIKIVKAGIRDGLKGVTGIHPLYRPGWDGK